MGDAEPPIPCFSILAELCFSFSGMLIATILGVLLVPMLFTLVGKLTGSKPPQTPPLPPGEGAPAGNRRRAKLLRFRQALGIPIRGYAWRDCGTSRRI